MSDKPQSMRPPHFIVTVEGDVFGEESPENREIVRRIHACVNACTSLSTDELERGIVDDLQQTVQNIVPLLEEQRDVFEHVLGRGPHNLDRVPGLGNERRSETA